MSDNNGTNATNKDNHIELNYNFYPSLPDKNDNNLLEEKKIIENVKIEIPLQIQGQRSSTRKLSRLATQKSSLLDFFFQISNPECKIPKTDIIFNISKFLKNSNLITHLAEENNEKKYTTSSLCTICAKRLTYHHYNKGDILVKKGNISDKLYLVLFGKLNVLKIEEVNNCLMTYQEYFDYLWFLHQNNEEYILNELFNKNYYLFQVSNYDEFMKVYHVYFSIILKNKLNSNEFNSIEDIKQFFIKYHRTLNEYDLNENTIQNLLNNKNDLTSYISSKTKQSLEDSIYFDKFQFLLTDDSKQHFTIFKYKHSFYYKYNDLIANFPLEQNQQHKSTIRCESECILASMTFDDYLNMTTSKRKDNKQNDIMFLIENFFFKEININVFEKNYFKWFVFDSYSRNYILYEEGTKPNEIFFLKEGSIQLEITCSIVDLHNLVKFLYQKILSRTNSSNLHKNNKQLLTKSQLTKLKRYTNDPELAGLKTQNGNFVREMFRVKTFDLSIINGQIALGIEELFLNVPYLNTAKVISQKGSVFKIEKNKFNEIIKSERTCLNSFMKLTMQRIFSLIERIDHIKRNLIEYSLHNTKIEEQNETKNSNSFEYNDLNKVNLTPKVNHIKIDMMLLQNQREYKHIHSTRNNSVLSIFKNKNLAKTTLINQEPRPKQLNDYSQDNLIVDKQNSMMNIFSQSNETKNNNNNNINSNNDNVKILSPVKKNLFNGTDEELLINLGDKYISLTNLEKELLHYNIRKITNTSSQMSITNSDNTLISNNDTEFALLSKNKYKVQILHNLLQRNKSTKHGSYHKLEQLYKLNYIPLNLNENNISIEKDKKRDGRIHLDKIRFLSQLKKYRKKYESASVDNFDSIQVIDSNKIPEKKTTEKGKPSMMLPSIVKDFYKNIQLKGYSGLVGENHTYLKKKIYFKRDKEPIEKKMTKLSTVFSTEMDKLKDNIMSKGTSFYLTNKHSSI